MEQEYEDNVQWSHVEVRGDLYSDLKCSYIEAPKGAYYTGERKSIEGAPKTPSLGETSIRT